MESAAPRVKSGGAFRRATGAIVARVRSRRSGPRERLPERRARRDLGTHRRLSGSGKSTLLRAANGLNRVPLGQVLVGDGEGTLIRRKRQDELLALQERVRKTILFVSHDLDEALKLGDKVSILEGGRIVQTGTARDIVECPADDYVAEFVAHVNPRTAIKGGPPQQTP